MDLQYAIITPPGAGFRLRPWRPDDLDALVRHANDEEVSRRLRDHFPFPYTRADGEAFLAGHVVDLTGPVFAIEVDGEACGGIAAHPGRGGYCHNAELGYWLGRSLWGRGLMTRVIGAFAPWVMRELRLYRLQASVLGDNLASARVLAKAGFVEEGLQRCAMVKRGELFDLRIFAKVRRSLDDE